MPLSGLAPAGRRQSRISARESLAAVSAVSSFSGRDDMKIYLVVYDKAAFDLSGKFFQSVKSYIDENYAAERPPVRRSEPEFLMTAPGPGMEDRIKHLDKPFSRRLLELIDSRGLIGPQVYKKANVDRKLFNKIKNNPDYRPGKSTALAFALALKLDLEGTEDLIGRAGYTLSHSSVADVVEYFITNRNYDIFRINEALFALDRPLLK